MGTQLTSNAEALALFFTEDIYLVDEPTLTVNTKEKVDEISAKASQVEEASQPEFKYLGKNQKGILILVNDQQNEVSTEQGRELLRKLVKAIELTANDFALVNYSHHQSVKYNAFKTFFDCKIMLAFGVDPTHLGLPSFLQNQLHAYHEAQLLFAKNLHDLDVDQASKKILWTSLQKLKA